MLLAALQAKGAAVRQDPQQPNTKLRYSVFILDHDVISVRYTLGPITQQHEGHPLKVIGDLFNCFVAREREGEREREQTHFAIDYGWLR